MRRREAIVATLTAVASAGCVEDTDTETQTMVDKLNLTDVAVSEKEFDNQDMMRAVDEEAGLVYIVSDGYNSVSLEVVPLGDTTL